MVATMVTIYADTAHWRGPYKIYAKDEARKTADRVACAALDIEPSSLLVLLDHAAWTGGTPPWRISGERQRWIANVTAQVLAAVAPATVS